VKNGDTEQVLAENRRLEDALRRQSDLLKERVKELECLGAIARLFDLRDAGPDETLQGVVEVVPHAWQYPEVAEARLEVDGKSYQTAGFRETPWCQTEGIMVRDTQVGTITVCYVDERPTRYEGPFLREERSLLHIVAQRLSGYIERSKALDSLLSYQQDLRRMASVLAVTEQRERRRIAQGLHDRIGQNLALASMRLAGAQQLVSPPEAARSIEEARRLITEVIAETRSLTFELCPPILYELGLGPALDWVGEQFEPLYDYRVIVREHGPAVSLPDDARATIFQAAREVLVNAGKHGRATTVDVDLYNHERGVELVIKDNGAGFDVTRLGGGAGSVIAEAALGAPAEAAGVCDPGASATGLGDVGFGLFSIRERLRFLGGSLAIESTPGRGTTVRLRVPLTALAEGASDGHGEEAP